VQPGCTPEFVHPECTATTNRVPLLFDRQFVCGRTRLPHYRRNEKAIFANSNQAKAATKLGGPGKETTAGETNDCRRWGGVVRHIDTLGSNKRDSQITTEAKRPMQREHRGEPRDYAAAVEEGSIGKRASTVVPLPLELISKLPPSCRSLSRIPLIPTPGVPVDATSSNLSAASPLRDPALASEVRRQMPRWPTLQAVSDDEGWHVLRPACTDTRTALG
jgi:hypothetical protein